VTYCFDYLVEFSFKFPAIYVSIKKSIEDRINHRNRLQDSYGNSNFETNGNKWKEIDMYNV